MKRAMFALAMLLLLPSCEREVRRFRELAPTTNATDVKTVSGLQAGPKKVDVDVKSPYAANAYAISQGQRLFGQMNCTGCHAHGGGAIGPPLMDDKWIYGSDPENIFASIAEGRPNGMPSFGGKLGDDSIWQLVAYVQSLSGNVRKDAAPGREDDMNMKQRELAKETEHPKSQKGQQP